MNCVFIVRIFDIDISLINWKLKTFAEMAQQWKINTHVSRQQRTFYVKQRKIFTWSNQLSFFLIQSIAYEIAERERSKKKKTQSNLTEKKRFFEHDTRI